MILLSNYLFLLLVFLPLSLIADLSAWPPELVFTFNFLAIVPLSGLVQITSEDLSANLPHVPGHLLIAFSDNAVELVVSYVHLDFPRVLVVTPFSRSVPWH